MKHYLLIAVSAALVTVLAACAMPPAQSTAPGPALTASQAAAQQLASAQMARNAACQTWSMTFKAALAARQAGIASPTLIQQITLGDSQFSPVCETPLPTDVATLESQTVKLMTSVGTMELLLKEMKK